MDVVVEVVVERGAAAPPPGVKRERDRGNVGGRGECAGRGTAGREHLSREDRPLALAEELRPQEVDQMHCVRQPVLLEERSRDVAEDQPLEQRAERARPLRRLRLLELGRGERLSEEREEHRQREPVHRVDAEEVEQREEELRADARHRPVHLALGVERVLELGALAQLLLDRLRLRLELVQRVDQLLVLEDVPLRVGELE